MSNDEQLDRETIADDAVPYTPAGFRQAGVIPAPSPATLHRWRMNGRMGHRLRTFLRGGRRYTTRSAIAEFFSTVTAATDNVSPRRSSLSIRQAVRAALRELERDGI